MAWEGGEPTGSRLIGAWESVNRYLNDSFNLDMANGCLYRGEDTPGGNYGGWNVAAPAPGDILDINVNFRGEIQRKGRLSERNPGRP